MLNRILFGLGYFVILIAMLGVFIWYQYTQKYVQDSTITATTGIAWTTTLNLKEYKRVSTGNDIWGQYDRYTRSDRHTDVLTIYCKEYCSK